MKKLLSIMLVAMLGVGTVVSCTSDDDGQYYQDQDTIAQVYELKNVNFDLQDGSYQIYRQFQTPLYNSDMVLVYRQSATSNGAPVWELLPKTIYLNDGNEVDYTFDFTRNDIYIYTGGTFNLANTEFIRNQTFRVLIIPAALGRGTDSPVNYEDYNSVVNYYNIKDHNIKGL